MTPDPVPEPSLGKQEGLLAAFSLDFTPLKVSRDYRLLFFSQTISFFGSMMSFVVLPWQMYQLTHSSLAVGLLSAVEFVPTITMAFVGGALADYVDRRRMVLITELFMAVSSAALVLNSMLPHPKAWLLFVCATALAGLNDWSDTYGGATRVGLVHAAANTTALILYTSSLAARRAGRRRLGRALGKTGLAAKVRAAGPGYQTCESCGRMLVPFDFENPATRQILGSLLPGFAEGL